MYDPYKLVQHKRWLPHGFCQDVLIQPHKMHFVVSIEWSKAMAKGSVSVYLLLHPSVVLLYQSLASSPHIRSLLHFFLLTQSEEISLLPKWIHSANTLRINPLRYRQMIHFSGPPLKILSQICKIQGDKKGTTCEGMHEHHLSPVRTCSMLGGKAFSGATSRVQTRIVAAKQCVSILGIHCILFHVPLTCW
jgi:hypothetical protein